MQEKGYKKLNVYQEAHKLVRSIYKATDSFPRSEIFGLTSQMRRAAVSVPANILEGYGREASREFRRFLLIAQGSLVELEYYIELALDLGYLSGAQYASIEEQRKTTGALLGGLIRSVKKSLQSL